MALEFALSVLGMDREEAAWLTPSATITRLMAAYAERQGHAINWGAERMERMLDILETQMDAAQPPPQVPE